MSDALRDTKEPVLRETYRRKRNTSFGRKIGRASTAEAFRRFHADHPEVYDLLVSLARQARLAGVRHYGICAVYEVARWHSVLARDPSERFILNNNYKPLYARLIMENEPDLRGFFRTRERTTI